MKAQRPSFLVVDDRPEDQMLIVRALQNFFTHPIHCVNGGNEALRYLNGEGRFADRSQFPFPTTIMTDLKMNDGDGFELLQNLKHNPLWAIIPTIVLSGSNDPDDIKTAYALGASCYLTKPQGHSELKGLMGKLVDFWKECEVPEIDVSGRMLKTESAGKLGERFPGPNEEPTRRD
jgi:CheY-like chemotaxis protein